MTVHSPSPRITAVTGGRNARPSAQDIDENRNRKRRRLQVIALVLLTFGLGSAELITDLLVGGRLPATATSTGNVAATSAGHLAGQVAAIAFYLGCLVIFVSNLSTAQRFPQLTALLLFLVFFAVVTTADFVASGGTGLRFSYYAVAILVVVAWSVQPHFEDLALVGGVGLLAAIASLALIPAGTGWMPDSYFTLNEKAIIGTRTLGGIYPQGNILGMVLSSTMPLMLLFRRRLLGFAAYGIAFWTLLLSASRTSGAGLAVSTAVVLVALLARREGVVKIIIVLGALFIAAVMVVLPIITTDPDAFTTRGQIWIYSIEHWDSLSALFFGSGLAIYGIGGDIALALGAPSYHGHNEFVTLMTETGIVAALLFASLFAVALARVLRLAHGRTLRVVSYFLLTLIGVCIAETPMRTDTIDMLTWATWLPFVLCFFAVTGNGGKDSTTSTGTIERSRMPSIEGSPSVRPRVTAGRTAEPTGRRAAQW